MDTGNAKWADMEAALKKRDDTIERLTAKLNKAEEQALRCELAEKNAEMIEWNYRRLACEINDERAKGKKLRSVLQSIKYLCLNGHIIPKTRKALGKENPMGG